MRQNGNDVSALQSDMMVDLARMTHIVVEKGLINVAFIKDLQQKWLDGLVTASRSATQDQVTTVMNTLKESAKVLIGLPNIMEYYVSLMIKPCEVVEPNEEILTAAKSKLLEV